MAEITGRKVRFRRVSTWGNPVETRDPRFVKVFARLLQVVNRILVSVIGLLLAIAVGLLVYLAYGIVYTKLYATDGSIYSCEVPYVELKRK